MERFYLEIPSIERKNEIIDYINELVLYNYDINGIEILAKILDGYTFEQALEYCLNLGNKEYAKRIGKCQVRTFLLIRENDNRVVGALNIRLSLSGKMKTFDGNIGYGIRPTERKKGYNKINLYLGLIEAQKNNINTVKLVCEASNLGSVKTIEALGGILEQTDIDPYDGILTSVYWFSVNETIDKYKEMFKDKIYADCLASKKYDK